MSYANTATDFGERLSDYAQAFRRDFPRADQARWVGIYLQGLLLGEERRNIEGMARRLTLPVNLEVADPAQALQNFINQSPWEEKRLWQRYRQLMAEHFAHADGVFVFSDVAIPKRGTNSVGVHRQFDHATGRKTNCQIGVALYYVSPLGVFPAGFRLYLPRTWLNDPDRLEATAVPSEYRRQASKGEIALELLDVVRGEGLPGRAVVAEGKLGGIPGFRSGLEERDLPYLVEVEKETPVAVQPTRPGLTTTRMLTLADLLRWQTLDWQDWSDDGVALRHAWTRVTPADGMLQAGAKSEPAWVLIEQQANRTLRYALSNLDATIPATFAAGLWQSRHSAHEVLRLLKDLGLDHFEGRSWRGFHHHVCLTALAAGFRLLEQVPV